jgi:predicted signal transduction protein with EAL and GGDEF domain
MHLRQAEQPDITHVRGTTGSFAAVATVVGLAGMAAATAALFVAGWISESVAGALCVAVAFVSVLAGRRNRPVGRAADGLGLAALVEKERVGGLLRVSMAAVVVELRGIAADTLVDGPAAWSEPIGVVLRRLTAADLGTAFSLARLGPHTFAAVFRCADHTAALAAAESLVALCRVPVQTPNRSVRIDAVAGVGFAEAGDRCGGEELIRIADAALRFDGRIASPVAAADGRLMQHARRVIEVETEIRHALDVDLLSAKLIPVLDVRLDTIVGVRSAYDWTEVSSSDPETLGSVAASLGLRRSLETHYLMRSIAAAESVPIASARRVVARLDPGRLADPRSVGQIGLLLEVSGIDADQLILEFEHWGAATIDDACIESLDRLGVGVGLAVAHQGRWSPVPSTLAGRLESLSASARDLIDVDGGRVHEDRVEQLLRLVDEEPGRITVCGVDSAPWALELSSVGLTNQCGLVHGKAMSAADMRRWVVRRAVG